MKRYFLLSLQIIIALSWTISTSSICPCSHWEENYCTIRVGCQWNVTSAVCQDYTCATFSNNTCNYVPYCYYNGSSCLNFNSCSSVPFNNQTACNSVHGCQYYTGNTCSDFSCSNYSSNSTECSSNWQCLYSNGQCTQATTCSSYDQEGCPNGQYCYWNGQVCSPATCNSLANNSCTFVFTTLTGTEIQPCITNSLNTSQCLDATSSLQFNKTECGTNTDDQYYWLTQQTVQPDGVMTTSGECLACTNVVQNHDQVLFAIITMLLIS